VSRPLVLKVGGELIEGELIEEEAGHLATVVSAVAAVVDDVAGLVVVHGGGREIDRALQREGIPKQQIDGLRLTD